MLILPVFMRKNRLLPVYLLACITISSCTLEKIPIDSSISHHATTENYMTPGLDHGLIQSPINILSAETNTLNKHKITLNYQNKINAIENLGHTIQLDFEEGSTISLDGMTYLFKQMHFHTPSEHLIDGMTFPMELHIVNYLAPKNKTDTPHYLVIAILFKMGKENKFMSEFLNLIPKEVNTTTQLTAGHVGLHDLLSGHINNDFYHYKGSLTTPPYTESVNWLVLKTIITASPEQIRTINNIEGNNARHIQGRYGRTVD